MMPDRNSGSSARSNNRKGKIPRTTVTRMTHTHTPPPQSDTHTPRKTICHVLGTLIRNTIRQTANNTLLAHFKSLAPYNYYSVQLGKKYYIISVLRASVLARSKTSFETNSNEWTNRTNEWDDLHTALRSTPDHVAGKLSGFS